MPKLTQAFCNFGCSASASSEHFLLLNSPFAPSTFYQRADSSFSLNSRQTSQSKIIAVYSASIANPYFFLHKRMYAETGLLFPYLQNFSQDIQQFEEYCKYQNANASTSNLNQNSTISEYDLGGEGDLFKAPEPIIEEPMGSLDPMSALSMISCSEEDMITAGLKVADIESIESEQLLSEVFYECEKDLWEKAALEVPFTEVLDVKFPIEENKLLPDVSLPKSISSGCLSSLEQMQGAAANGVKPSFLDFSVMDIGSIYGMRRAYSEGDIQTLGNGITGLMTSPLDGSLVLNNSANDLRREKLSRYRNKKSKRNFGRKIKYACRKALADSQPRIRGRFAKTEECDVFKRQ